MTSPGTPSPPAVRPSRLALQLATVGIAGVLLALVAGRAELVLVAAPCLAALAVTGRRRPPVPTVRVSLSESRCFEDEPVQLRIEVECPARAGQVRVQPFVPDLIGLEPAGPHTRLDVSDLAATWTLRPHRWGRWRLGPVTVQVWDEGWGRVRTTRVEVGDLVVFPPPARARDLTVPPRLRTRIGSHVSRVPGAGTEFVGIRRYVPGDVPRRINWPVSTRRGALHVNTYADERAAEVVAIVDTTTDLGPHGDSSLDNAVRGAAAVAQSYLTYTDRVGIIGFGTPMRWLTPDVGARQYYRIVETVLGARRDTRSSQDELAPVPRPALPSGALVFVFSPLVDPQAFELLRDLRERGHPVIVVDVLSVRPAGDGSTESDLAARVWRLDREVALHGLREMGAIVLGWHEEGGVDLERLRLEPLLGGAR